VLRKLLGDISEELGEGGNLWATCEVQPAALIRSAVTSGRGDPILSCLSWRPDDQTLRRYETWRTFIAKAG
jgi:hypothetical protein